MEPRTIVHYPLEECVSWKLVPNSDAIHSNGCGDTLAGVFVGSVILSELNHSSALKRALTASQISLRSTTNVPISIPLPKHFS